MTERDGKELTATALRALGGEIRREGRSTYWQLPSGSPLTPRRRNLCDRYAHPLDT